MKIPTFLQVKSQIYRSWYLLYRKKGQNKCWKERYNHLKRCGQRNSTYEQRSEGGERLSLVGIWWKCISRQRKGKCKDTKVAAQFTNLELTSRSGSPLLEDTVASVRWPGSAVKSRSRAAQQYPSCPCSSLLLTWRFGNLLNRDKPVQEQASPCLMC